MSGESAAAARLAQSIRKLSRNNYDKIEYATITAPPPSVRIRVDNLPFDLDRDDLVIPDHLLEHERTARINAGDPVTITFDHALHPGTRVLVVAISEGQKYAILGTLGGGK